MPFLPSLPFLERTVNLFGIPAYNNSVHSCLSHELRDTVTCLTFIWKKNKRLNGILLIPLSTHLFYIVSTTIVTQSLELNLKMQNCQSHTWF